jgi:hypothetical protein
MDNDTTAQQTPENDTQDSAMPTENQQTAQSEGVDESAGQITEDAASTETEDSTLPENASDRTREQFEKLRSREEDLRKSLQEERQRRELAERTYQSMQPKQEQQEEVAPLYDPNSGLLNEQVLTDVQKRAMAAEKRATQAEQSIQNYLNEQENRETFNEYPELNPNDTKTFNKDLHITTRQILLDSMVNPQDYENKQLSFREAAALAKTRLPGALDNAKKEGAQEAMEQLTPKEQASLAAVGSASRRGDVGNLEELRKRTRKGDHTSSIQRMKSILGEK